MRPTQIRPVQRLVREPDLKPASALLLAELDDGEARAVDCDGVSDVTVRQDGRRIPDGERASACITDNVGHCPKMFNLQMFGELDVSGVTKAAAYQTCEHCGMAC